MNKKIAISIVIAVLALALIGSLGLIHKKQNQASEIEERIADVVKKVLISEPPRGYAQIPLGTKLLGVEFDDTNPEKLMLTLDFSKELVSQGNGRILEDSAHLVTTVMETEVLLEEYSHLPLFKIDYLFLVEGKPIDYREDEERVR